MRFIQPFRPALLRNRVRSRRKTPSTFEAHMKSKLFRRGLKLAVGICVVTTMQLWAASLTDYGAFPTLSKPPQDQLAANQKLDFHTDLFTGRFSYQVPIEVPPGRGGSEPSIALQYTS